MRVQRPSREQRFTQKYLRWIITLAWISHEHSFCGMFAWGGMSMAAVFGAGVIGPGGF
jgi:hypothetical protein